jgi:hypothetical protein
MVYVCDRCDKFSGSITAIEFLDMVNNLHVFKYRHVPQGVRCRWSKYRSLPTKLSSKSGSILFSVHCVSSRKYFGIADNSIVLSSCVSNLDVIYKAALHLQQPESMATSRNK